MAVHRIKVSEMKKILGFYHDNDELRDVSQYTDKETGEDKLKLDIANWPIPEHLFGHSPWTNEQGICLWLSTKQGCYWCCERCNYAMHRCGGCGASLTHYEIIDAETLDKHKPCT